MGKLNFKIIKKIALGISVICSCALYISTANADEDSTYKDYKDTQSNEITDASFIKNTAENNTEELQENSNIIANYTDQIQKITINKPTKSFIKNPVKTGVYISIGSLFLLLAIGLSAKRYHNKSFKSR